VATGHWGSCATAQARGSAELRNDGASSSFFCDYPKRHLSFTMVSISPKIKLSFLKAFDVEVGPNHLALILDTALEERASRTRVNETFSRKPALNFNPSINLPKLSPRFSI
jgi:hypothetical protein